MDHEWTLRAPRRLIIVVLKLELGPDSTLKEPVVQPYEPVEDVDVLVPKVGERGPVFVITREEAHCDLIDESMSALLFELRLRLRCFVRGHVALRQSLVDYLEPHPDGRLVRRCAILPQ